MEFLDYNFKAADKELIAKYQTFSALLTEYQKEGKVLFVYRGDNIENISQKLKGSPSEVLPADRVFEYGDKAKHYYMDSTFEGGAIKNINDTSVDTLSYIFDRLQNVIASSRHFNRAKKHLSKKFIGYFIPENRASFIEAIASAPNRHLIRDYYLYLLHTAGTEGILEETLLVSTTTKRRVAKGFSTFSKKSVSEYARIIFHYYIPAPPEKYAIAPWLISSQIQPIQNLGLPTYNPMGLYPEQNEVGVKGALFPSFILGIELLAQKQFIINPYISLIHEEMMDMFVPQGIPVNQDLFEKNIFHTGFKRWVQTDGSGSFTQQDVVK